MHKCCRFHHSLLPFIMEHIIGWELTRAESGCWIRTPHSPAPEKVTLDDHDNILNHLRNIISEPYGNYLRKRVAEQLFPHFCELKSVAQEERENDLETCQVCGCALCEGACERCTRKMLRFVKPQQPRPHSREFARKTVEFEVGLFRKWHAASMGFDMKYRKEHSRYYSEEALAQWPVFSAYKSLVVDQDVEPKKSRLARLGQWLRKKVLCGF